MFLRWKNRLTNGMQQNRSFTSRIHPVPSMNASPQMDWNISCALTCITRYSRNMMPWSEPTKVICLSTPIIRNHHAFDLHALGHCVYGMRRLIINHARNIRRSVTNMMQKNSSKRTKKWIIPTMMIGIPLLEDGIFPQTLQYPQHPTPSKTHLVTALQHGHPEMNGLTPIPSIGKTNYGQAGKTHLKPSTPPMKHP